MAMAAACGCGAGALPLTPRQREAIVDATKRVLPAGYTRVVLFSECGDVRYHDARCIMYDGCVVHVAATLSGSEAKCALHAIRVTIIQVVQGFGDLVV